MWWNYLQIADLEFADALASPDFVFKRLADPFSQWCDNPK